MAEDRMLSDEILLGLIKANGGGGGTSDYSQLSNKPQINGNTLTGDKSASDLGLVAAETGKVLSSNDYTNEDKAIVGGVTAALAGKQDTLTAGNYVSINNDTISVRKTISDKSFNEYVPYSGTIREITVPYTGTYKLQVWGASGGSSSVTRGGYGGYSEGLIDLTANDVLFVVVGGHGNRSTGDQAGAAGYNGGGVSNNLGAGNVVRGTGGGATHIARKTGLLSELSDDISDILIVAGGGGGAGNYESFDYSAGGSGGGYRGADGTNVKGSSPCGAGGKENAGGTGYDSGSFGQGGNRTSSSSYGGSGGGGGLYGGGASQNNGGGGGGSGYLNPSIVDGCMYGFGVPESSVGIYKTVSVNTYDSNPTEKVAKEGDGYAVITLYTDSSLDLATKKDVDDAIATKVDKETGKGLSTNDFTDAYKTAISDNTTAIEGIKDGQSIDSFADVETALAGKQNTLTFDDVPTDNSDNPVKSNGIYDALATKQNATDNNLQTTDKTVVGAINEHEGDIDSLKSGLTNVEDELNGDATVYPYADVITIEDAVPANVADCSVKVEPVQSGSGDPSPTNVRPITGHTEVVVTVTDDAENPTVTKTYTIALGDTRYGGVLDVDSGAYSDFGGMADENSFSYGSGQTSGGGLHWCDYAVDVVSNVGMSNMLPKEDSAWDKTYPCVNIYESRIRIYGNFTSLAEFKEQYSGLQVYYQKATPTTIQLTPQQIQLLKGQNTLTASTGNISVTVNGVSEAIGQMQEQVNDHEERIEAVESGLTGVESNIVNINTALTSRLVASRVSLLPGGSLDINLQSYSCFRITVFHANGSEQMLVYTSNNVIDSVTGASTFTTTKDGLKLTINNPYSGGGRVVVENAWT